MTNLPNSFNPPKEAGFGLLSTRLFVALLKTMTLELSESMPNKIAS